mgnify:CR=1 FL=1
MNGRIEIKGAVTVAKTLRKAGIQLTELKPINLDAAEIAMRQAKRDAPVKSGAMRDTIRAGATNRAGVVRAGNNRARGVPYAGVVHWGWPKRGIKANPFMRRAAKKTEPEWTALYEQIVDKALSQVKGK